MKQNEKAKKKSSPVLVIVIIAAMFLMTGTEFLSANSIALIVGFAFILIPVITVVALIAGFRKQKKSSAHTHDRIDHSSDLKIDSRTGKADHVPLRREPQHSAREHWKEQLDGLLANGTIDRAEYRAMMNRKF